MSDFLLVLITHLCFCSVHSLLLLPVCSRGDDGHSCLSQSMQTTAFDLRVDSYKTGTMLFCSTSGNTYSIHWLNQDLQHAYKQISKHPYFLSIILHHTMYIPDTWLLDNQSSVLSSFLKHRSDSCSLWRRLIASVTFFSRWLHLSRNSLFCIQTQVTIT